MECTKCLGSIITNAACCTREIKKLVVNKKKIFTKISLKFK